MEVPEHIQLDLENVIRSAINLGVSPEQFKLQTAVYWEIVLRENIKHADKVFLAKP